MEFRIFNILSSTRSKKIDKTVSFKKFAQFLADKVNCCDGFKGKFYRVAFLYLKKNTELLLPVHVSRLKDHKPLFNLLEAIIVPQLEDERQLAMALSVPFADTFFFTTAGFYRLALKHRSSTDIALLNEREQLFEATKKQHKYALILERLYSLPMHVPSEIIHVWRPTATDIVKYFKLQVDTRFVEVVSNKPLPEIDLSSIQQKVENTERIAELEKNLPLQDFGFSGFSILTATDVTPQYALHKMRSAIIKRSPDNYDETYTSIIDLLKSLCAIEGADFGLLPFLKLNNKLVSYYKKFSHSIMINISRKLNFTEEDFIEWLNNYNQSPHSVLKKGCSNDGSKSDALYQAFTEKGFKAYSLLPVYYNEEVAGLLEISVREAEQLNSSLLSRVDSAMPILGQLMHQNQTEFNSEITKVISMNFTSIQPSVEWKFNEVAWNYIKSNRNSPLLNNEAIRFAHVHPLYGAIDMRNSTVERNTALHKDMEFYFRFVREILYTLQDEEADAIKDLEAEAGDLQQQTELNFSGNEETMFDGFMNRATAYLSEFAKNHPGYRSVTDKYFKEIDVKTGEVYARRRALEASMQAINFGVNKYLELMYTELQQRFPIYFEKFRTDGIEYDIYVGQSLTPKRFYNENFLNELRYIQLQSMAAIAKLVQSLNPSLQVELQTTQLIYVNAAAIDISFRADEKRFDVEGGYNIRYQIVKKRIDKVHIKNSGERLTQPGKVAIVYTQPEHEEEYKDYINQLVEEGMLQNDCEVLELEELQGVTGLKAIRVSAVLD